MLGSPLVQKEEAMGKNYLTANEAKELSNAATTLINSIMRNIRNCAERGEVKTLYSTCNLSKVAKEQIVSNLKGLGYDVYCVDRTSDDEFSIIETMFEISW